MTKKILIAYAYNDVSLVNKLKRLIGPLERQKLVKLYDDEIREANKTASTFLTTADIVLLLVGPEFLDSDYCYSDEMKQAIMRHEKGEAHVIPVILRPAYWKRTLFSKLQALPRGDQPVTLRRDQIAALQEVVAAIKEIVPPTGGVVRTRRMRVVVLAILLVVLIAGAIVGPVLKLVPPFASRAAGLTVIGTVAPGKSVMVHGTNFPPGSRINLTLDGMSIALAFASHHSMSRSLYDINLPTTFAGYIIVRNDGTFDAQVVIPANWQPNSQHAIQAQVIGQGGVVQDVHQVRLSIAPTPTPVPPLLDPHPLKFTINVDPLQLKQPNTITQVQDQVNKQLNESNTTGRKVGFVITLAGGASGDNHAEIFNSILGSMSPFQGAVFKNYHNLGNPEREFDLEVYFLG